MKIRLYNFGDALLVGYILLVGSSIYVQGEMPLFARAIIVVGLLIIWLIMGGSFLGSLE